MGKELFLIGDPFSGLVVKNSYLSHCAQELKEFLGPAEEGDIIVYVNAEVNENSIVHPFERAKDFFVKIGYKVISIGNIDKPQFFISNPEVKAFFVEGRDIYNLIHFLKDTEVFDLIASLVKDGQKKYIGSGDGLLVSCPFIYSGDVSDTIPWGVEGLNLMDIQIHQNISLKLDESKINWFRKFYDIPLFYLSKRNWIVISGEEITKKSMVL